MANYAQSLKPAEFGGIAFPIENLHVECGIRHHVHEFPHQQGAALEKLGRHLYGVTCTAWFLTDLLPDRYKGLFPTRLNALRKLWEAQTTDDFHIPHIGDMKMCCVKWRELYDTKVTNGVKVDLELLEDMDEAFGFANMVTATPRSIATKVVVLNSVLSQLEKKGVKIPLLSLAMSIADQVLAYKDKTELYGNLIESKILGLISILRQADAQVKELNEPKYVELLEAFRELCSATVDLHKDVMQIGFSRKTYTVPITTTLSAIATTLYQDSRKAVDLLRMNAITDPFNIPSGTVLTYYAFAEQKAA